MFHRAVVHHDICFLVRAVAVSCVLFYYSCDGGPSHFAGAVVDRRNKRGEQVRIIQGFILTLLCDPTCIVQNNNNVTSLTQLDI